MLCRPNDSTYLNRFRCSARVAGAIFTSMRLCASCKPPQASHWNLSDAPRSSLPEKARRHEDTLEFCSTSRERSRNASSRLVTFSHHRHFV